jgi:dUTP pyrophosphatase
MRSRGFEFVKGYEDENKEEFLPQRKTELSAGYDIKSMEFHTIPPGGKVIVKTGLKAYMPHDEYLALHIRSGIAIKNDLELVNQTGIIDADYYNNPGNEGHILCAIRNVGEVDYEIKKGDRIVQGIFTKYLRIDEDIPGGQREGGIQSTGR